MNHVKQKMMSAILNMVFALSWILAGGISSEIHAEGITASENEEVIREAILQEEWGKVAVLLDSVDAQTPSPVLRMIKGHATLALNRNNESLCQFLSVSSEDDIKKWEKWSQGFVKENPNNVIAH